MMANVLQVLRSQCFPKLNEKKYIILHKSEKWIHSDYILFVFTQDVLNQSSDGL